MVSFLVVLWGQVRFVFALDVKLRIYLLRLAQLWGVVCSFLFGATVGRSVFLCYCGVYCDPIGITVGRSVFLPTVGVVCSFLLWGVVFLLVCIVRYSRRGI